MHSLHVDEAAMNFLCILYALVPVALKDKVQSLVLCPRKLTSFNISFFLAASFFVLFCWYHVLEGSRIFKDIIPSLAWVWVKALIPSSLHPKHIPNMTSPCDLPIFGNLQVLLGDPW